MSESPSLTAGRCMEPKDKRPNITTYFCVYPNGHDGSHSWAETADARRERMKREGWK